MHSGWDKIRVERALRNRVAGHVEVLETNVHLAPIRATFSGNQLIARAGKFKI